MRIKNKMELKKELKNAEGTTGVYKHLYIFADGSWDIQRENYYYDVWNNRIMFINADLDIYKTYTKLFEHIEKEISLYYDN